MSRTNHLGYLPPMRVYAPHPTTDLLIARWWCRMQDLGDITRVFSPGATLSSLFTMIAPPGHAMLYEEDEAGIWFAAWLEPVLAGVFLGAWCDPSRRRTRACLHAFLHTFDWVLATVPTIIGVTKQEALLAEHRRLGYDVLGKIDGLFHGEDAWIVVLTRAAFEVVAARYGYDRVYPMGQPRLDSSPVEAR